MTAKYWLYFLIHVVVFLLGCVVVATKESLAGTFSMPFIEGVGASIAATGVSGMIIFAYVFVSSRTSDQLALLQAAGLLKVFTYRSVAIRPEYTSRLDVATQRIDIIGFGLRALREDFAAAFDSWAGRAVVRILLLDPEFPTAAQSLAAIRDTEEQNAEGSIANDVREFARAVGRMRDRSRFHVKLYRAIPAINYFRIDNEAFWGPYLIGVQSRNTPTFLIARNGALFDPLQRHFDALWQHPTLSRDIPKEWVTP